ncbi:MAG: SUMF1/EgtB/PvdO family nonheme iron enzyme [Anaerolineae bacterium]|nr:SUMF1/EgtB/PvdO family nonheme iron enzyme [Anaerolineae bacterium]
MSPSKLTSEVWPVVDPGQASAEREDSVLIYQPADPTEAYHSGSLYIVASSLSSGERGQIASRYAAQKVMSAYFDSDEPDLGLRLREAIEAANADLYAHAQERPELVKVGVVIVATTIRGELAHIAQVGDSRAYLIRDGYIQQLTRDHTLVQQLLDEGAITPDEAPSHPRRDVLLRTLGTQETPTVDVFDTRLRPDDALVLCSNTLPRTLTDNEISQVVASKAPRNAAEMLVQKVRGQGIKQGMAVIATLLRDGAPPAETEIPYTWDRQPPSFDNQPTLMMKRVSRQEEQPAVPQTPPVQTPAIDRDSPAAQTQQPASSRPAPSQTQPAPSYQTPVQPAPSYEEQPPPASIPISPGYAPVPQQAPIPSPQQQAPSGYVIDPVTGLPPVPQGQAGWGAPQGGYAPRIYQPPGQPNVRQTRRGVSIGAFALLGLVTVLLVVGMVLILVNPLGWELPSFGEAAQAATATPTVSLPTPTLPAAEVATEPPPTTEPVEQPSTPTEPAPSGMVLVEGGAFLRGVPDEEVEAAVQSCIQEDERSGNPSCYREYFSDAQPVEQVTVSPFYIDTTEVTNRAYAACVAADICTLPEKQEFYNEPNYAEHPVTYVTWEQARVYCQWAGKRLPWEAEWEKAARWDPRSEQSYVYPWGNNFEAGRTNTAAAGRGGTSPVTEFAQDISPWGIYDMAGNVSEWVSDWYNSGYQGLGTLNPRGPDNQPFDEPFRVARGGSFQALASYARAGQRFDVPPITAAAWLGFRCVVDASSAAPVATPTSSEGTEVPDEMAITPTVEGAVPTEETAEPVP